MAKVAPSTPPDKVRNTASDDEGGLPTPKAEPKAAEPEAWKNEVVVTGAVAARRVRPSYVPPNQASPAKQKDGKRKRLHLQPIAKRTSLEKLGTLPLDELVRKCAEWD